jgi:hypothetical protein
VYDIESQDDPVRTEDHAVSRSMPTHGLQVAVCPDAHGSFPGDVGFCICVPSQKEERWIRHVVETDHLVWKRPVLGGAHGPVTPATPVEFTSPPSDPTPPPPHHLLPGKVIVGSQRYFITSLALKQAARNWVVAVIGKSFDGKQKYPWIQPCQSSAATLCFKTKGGPAPQQP